MKSSYIVGVDSLDNDRGYEVTVLDGLKTVSNAKFEGRLSKVTDLVVKYLEFLVKEFNCQISIENNRDVILLPKIKDKLSEKYLYRTSDKLIPKRYKTGFFLNKSLLDNWDSIKEFIPYNEDYEHSTMIAVMSKLNEDKYYNAFILLQSLYEQINKLESELGIK